MFFRRSYKKNKTKKISKLPFKLRISALALFVILPTMAQARTFDPNNIITDADLTNKDALSKTAIQVFLERENSVLARYSQIINGVAQKASEIIWNVGQATNINPEFLLTTLEKEQGLVQKSSATEKALDWATGYSCFNGGCKDKYQGFYNQVQATAETQQIYWDRAGQFSFKVGQTTMTYDGYPVTPANKATANLYIYTPHVGKAPELGINVNYGANKLFWRIWNRYFTGQNFLDGQVVRNGNDYWLIADNQKRKFTSETFYLKNHTANEAIVASTQQLNAYPDGPTIKYADNTLVKSDATGQMYLLVGLTKRPVIDNNALALLKNYSIAITNVDLPFVPEADLSGYTLGPWISASSIYPQGQLFKDETGTIWQVQDGLKHLVDPVVWKNKFAAATPEPTTSDQLNQYPTSTPILFDDGTFVLSGGKYYLISDGQRMRIDDPGIFNRTFGPDKQASALTISTDLLNLHPAGEIIDYVDSTIKDPAITPAGSVAGEFESITPDSIQLITGQAAMVSVKFKNTGQTTWTPTTVWVQVSNKNDDQTSFGVMNKITLDQASVQAGQTGSFTFQLTAPIDQNGLLTQNFNLYSNHNGSTTKLATMGKFIIVKTGDSAEIISHNLPLAVKNTWKPVQITMKVKNNSQTTSWLSRRTALELYNDDGSTSIFYDANDWVRPNVVGVPLNKATIKPGDNAEFKFTLNPRRIKKGSYILKFRLRLLDKNNKVIYLNGGEFFKQLIRVD
ncbi:MAG: type VII secretion protein EccB [Patescibacteria group bacterium]|nr:type VII secretion protein EccB [Patescibacteria group bacterium]